jgi:uncharacterized damage-inducible protein DinB
MSRLDGTASEQFLHSMTETFRSQKRSAERAISQLPDEKLHVPLDANTNSVAVIMNHMAGNLVSRFTDFLTTDGEKPSRDRDAEFVDDVRAPREQIMRDWERGWAVLFDALASLRPEDLTKTITIRQEPWGVIDALHRALAHQAYHVGQIIQLARYLAKDEWETITIPRGGSQAFNRAMGEQHGQ